MDDDNSEMEATQYAFVQTVGESTTSMLLDGDDNGESNLIGCRPHPFDCALT